MKRKMTVAVLSTLGVVALIFIIGLMLPKEREFVKQAELKSPPEKVFHIVSDFKNQASWRDDVQKIEVIDQETWIEFPEKGTPLTFRIQQKVENHLLEIEIIEPKSFDGKWIGTFEKTPTGTKVLFKEIVIISNPFFRVLTSIFVDLEKTMDLYMENLKAKLVN